MAVYYEIPEEEQEAAIKEKEKQLINVYVNKKSTPEDLAQKITERRLNWFKENKNNLYLKYILNGNGMRLEEIAFKVIYLDHMKINLSRLQLIDLNKNGIKILCYNFCPYLFAWHKLKKEGQINIDSREICEKIVEPGVNSLLETICKDLLAKRLENGDLDIPYLKFSRDYNQIRPYSDFCAEFIRPKTK